MLRDHYEPIHPAVDKAFHSLITGFFADPKRDIGRLSQNLLPPFEAVALDYLFANPDAETARKYYKNHRLIWSEYFWHGRLLEAGTYLILVVGPIHRREARLGTQFPKGPAYYFMGGTALLQGDLDRAFLLMHTSFREDVRLNAPQPTPAAKFVTLDFEDANQFFGPSVSQWAEHLNDYVVRYRLLLPSQFTREDFRRRLLQLVPSPDLAFSFTHTLARLHHLIGTSHYALMSDFAGQYELNILFDLALVIDNAIAAKYPSALGARPLTPDYLSHLSSSRGWALTPGHLTNAVNQDVRTRGFDTVILDLIDRVYQIPHPVASPNLEADLLLVYVIRNRGAHNVFTSRAVTSRFRDILQSMCNILFLAVDTLYP